MRAWRASCLSFVPPRSYDRHAQTRGAILLAVVGAKLSEGINFSDDLCRCVIVISVPYPSTGSIELKERMAYVTELGKARDGGKGGDAGKLLCESGSHSLTANQR